MTEDQRTTPDVPPPAPPSGPGGWGTPPPPYPAPSPGYGGYRPPGAYGPPQGGYLPPPGYPVPYPAGYGLYPAPPPVPLSALPDGPREYHQLLRGRRARWWKPLLSLLMVAAFALPLMVAAFAPVLLVAVLAGARDPLVWIGEQFEGDLSGPAVYAYLLLSLAVLIPAAMWATWIVHGVRPGFLSSVAGRIRWRWGLRCVLLLTPVWVVYLGVSVLLGEEPQAPPAQWLLLLALSVLLMPFQAAGEEYLFRGWILQNVGAWFRRPVVGLVAGTAVSSGLFALAHGSLDVWVLADLIAIAVTVCLLTWRTGGLEAAVALHAVNNVGVSIVSVGTGSWAESFIDPTTTSTPTVFAVSLLVDLVALALLWWQAGRVGLQRRFIPAAGPAPSGPALAAPPYAAPAPLPPYRT